MPQNHTALHQTAIRREWPAGFKRIGVYDQLKEGLFGMTMTKTAICCTAFLLVITGCLSHGDNDAAGKGRVGELSNERWVQSLLIKKSDVSAFAFDDRDVYAAARGSGVFRTGDNGKTWHQLRCNGLPAHGWIRSMVYCGRTLFAGVYNAGVFSSSDGGRSWTAVNAGLNNMYVKELVTAGRTVWAGTDDGIFYRDISGNQWTAANTGLTSTDISDLAAGKTGLFALTHDRRLFRYRYAGAEWVAVDTGLNIEGYSGQLPVSAMAISDSGLFAFINSAIYRSTDSGISWKYHISGDMRWGGVTRMRAVRNSVYAVCGDKMLFNQGYSFIAWNKGPSSVTSLAGNGHRVAAGVGYGVFVSESDSVNYQPDWTGLKVSLTRVRAFPNQPASVGNDAGGNYADTGRRSDSLALLAIKKHAHVYGRERRGVRTWDSLTTLDRWAGIYLRNNRVAGLTVQRASLSLLPPEIGRLSGLTQLNLALNDLTTLPAEIGNCTLLQEIDISNQSRAKDGIDSLPHEIGKLIHLQTLNASSCGLKKLAPEIGNCAGLANLIIDRNLLDSLPAGIGRLTNLVTLEMWANQLTCIPPEIGNLTNLKHLNCGANRLTAIPREIGKLKSLETLNLSRNYAVLASLPAELCSLSNLTSLDLSECGLTAIPQGIGALTRLTKLYLGENRLSTLPEGIADLKKVDTVIIASNNIEEVDLPPRVVAWLDRIDPDWRKTQPQNIETLSKGLGRVPDTVSDSVRSRIITVVPVSSVPHSYSEHEYEAEGPPAGRYCALCCRDSSCWIDTVQLHATQDSIESFYSGMVKGRIVKTDYRPEMLLLVRGIPGLVPGPLKTWYCNPLWRYSFEVLNKYYPLNKKRLTQKIELDSIGTFEMTAIMDQTESGYYQWRVRFGNEPWWTLPIVPGQTSSDPSWAPAKLAILWIGDLDNDGAPDMIMRPILDFDGLIQLFLSSQRRPNHLWKSAATFYHYPPGAGD
jgi:Leucine-rich repeat (LRR) protein/photosystem II stability/assembly factor-like uncharacterized protein